MGREGHLFKPRGRPAVLANKLHDQDVLSKKFYLWGKDAAVRKASEISSLFFRPRSNHLAWIAFAVTLKPKLSSDILISVLEDEN